MSDDIETWLLFAPFWLLGIAALIGAVWHLGHAAQYARRPKTAGVARHHVRRGFVAFVGFLTLCLGGLAFGLLGR